MEYGDGLNSALAELSGLILSEENLDKTLQRVASLASRVTPRAAAGVTLIEGKRFRTAASTQELVDQIDAVQYETGEGPCMYAMEIKQVVHIQSVAEDDRWEPHRKAALARGVSSVLGVPLLAREQVLGCLNLYCIDGKGFEDVEIESAEMFAHQAGVALHNSQLYLTSVRLAEQLQEALGSRAVIDQAKGILMERERVGADEAFEMLRQASQNLNIKVREIAQKLVDETASAKPEGRDA